MNGCYIPDRIAGWLDMARRADQQHAHWSRKAAAEPLPHLREYMEDIAADAMGVAYAARLEAELLMLESGATGSVIACGWH